MTFSLFQVKKASVMYDPHSRESRGFGFVTMESGEEADAAIAALNGTDLMGKVMSVEKVIRVLPPIISTPS
jgi:transformer-2 protein